jgi:hypothetical protein
MKKIIPNFSWMILLTCIIHTFTAFGQKQAQSLTVQRAMSLDNEEIYIRKDKFSTSILKEEVKNIATNRITIEFDIIKLENQKEGEVHLDLLENHIPKEQFTFTVKRDRQHIKQIITIEKNSNLIALVNSEELGIQNFRIKQLPSVDSEKNSLDIIQNQEHLIFPFEVEKAQLYQTDGKILKSINHTCNEFSLENFPNGIYVLKTEKNDKVYSNIIRR